MPKRKLEIAVLSDIHLGTYGCQAKEVVNYLKSIKPKILVLNGDIIDIWQFSKRYWPKSHMLVIKELVKIAARGTPIYYLTGNHDEMLRKFTDFHLGNFHLMDQLEVEVDGKKAWIFHGDVFDASIQQARWLAKLGGYSYDLLIVINSIINWCMLKTGQKKVSLSKAIKNSVKKAVSYISDFEEIAAEMAIRDKYDYVICGHIHQPQIREIVLEEGRVTYLNSGDWVENLTALEYHSGQWHIFEYQPSEVSEEVQPEIALQPLILKEEISLAS
ncbi:MAG: UDP-2,3-diacylglucosamine diphosphatase [Bacteroidota bacterium]